MKRTILIVFSTLTAMLYNVAASAQNTDLQTFHIAGGNYVSNGNISLSSTFGQTVTLTFSGGNNKLTQGFQQPFLLMFMGCMNCRAQNYDPTATADDGTCITTCPGDMDFSGNVGVADLLSFIGQYGLSGPCLLADLNADGAVGVTDLLLFIGAYGVTCM